MTNHPDQLTFEIESGEKARDNAIDQVTAHASKEFIKAGREAIKECAQSLHHFTSDDVWLRMPEGVQTHEPRAMAAIFKYAQKQHWIAPTSEYRASVRPEAHRGPKRVWESCLEEKCKHLSTHPIKSLHNEFICDDCLKWL